MVQEESKDEFGVPFNKYPECSFEGCLGVGGRRVGLNYIGLCSGENPHDRTDGGGRFYCYECCGTFD